MGTEGGGCRWFVLLFCLTSAVSYGVALLPVSSDAAEDWLWLLSLMGLLWRCCGSLREMVAGWQICRWREEWPAVGGDAICRRGCCKELSWFLVAIRDAQSALS